MEDSTRKWLTGCGIGCVSVVILAGLVVFGGYLGVKKMIKVARETSAGMELVSDTFGRAAEFTPNPDGTVPPDRVEAFLRARNLCAAERTSLEASLGRLSGTDSVSDGAAVGGFFQSLQAGIGFMPQMMAYVNARNGAFLEAEMGLGEYLYLYTLIYESWLEKPPSDGPPFMLVGGEVESRGWSEADIREQRTADFRGRLNRSILPMLRNQLGAITGAESPEDVEWAESLRTEILLLEADGLRLPWQDGLPPATSASFEPFYEALEASYSALCHPVELAVMQQ